MTINKQVTTLFALLMFFSFNAKEQDYQQSSNFLQETKQIIYDPFVPISFSANGINNFFTNVFNKSSYATEFLPNNFSHLLEFLQYGLQAKQNASFAQSAIKLFSNKLKASSYVNAYAFTQTLKPLQELLTPYFLTPKPRTPEQLKTAVNDVLYTSFLSQFDFFKKNPTSFFDTLSTEILTSINYELENKQQEMLAHQLSETVVRFLELCLGKLVWSPENPMEAWESIRTMLGCITELLQHNIIKDVDHLDDLLWSVTHRFCFFIDLVGTHLPLDFYQKVETDLKSKDILFSQIEEQESYITSKTDHIQQALLTGQAKVRAYQSGMVYS